jgi:hypothetical protein
MALLNRRQFQQLLFRSVVHPDLEHRKLGFEIPRPFLCRLKRRKYRLHPAIDFQAKALGHHKVSARDVARLRLVRYRQRLFHGNSFGLPPPYLVTALLDRRATPFCLGRSRRSDRGPTTSDLPR